MVAPTSSTLYRLKDFVFQQKCIPWSVSNRYDRWLERDLHFRSRRLYGMIKFGRIKEIVQPLTKGPNHHFFGYYEKSPWNKSEDKILAHEALFNDRPPTQDDRLIVGFVSADNSRDFNPIAETFAWNWQQGAMLQWHPCDADNKVLYNNRVDDQFVGICRNINDGTETVYERPIYAISPCGDQGFSLNFSRLYDKRPGYGYAGIADSFAKDNHSEKDGVFSIDMGTGKSRLIISLHQLANLNPLPAMKDTPHWVNHIQISPNGKRLAFFHIWRTKEDGWSVRLYSAKLDGSQLKCVLDTGSISHYDWQDDSTILVWAKHPQRGAYFLYCNVEDGGIRILGEKILTEDGHCSFSPDRKWVLNDTYPDSHDLRTLMLVRRSDGKRIDLQRFYSPKAKWWGEIRCDLHPRWNRSGNQVCVDSVHSGQRQMYLVELQGIV